MGFISFNEKYYQKKLEEYENNSLSESEIYEAKQLLKILDDLADEGYTNLNNRMETDFSCITRLREVLKNNGAIPFPIDHERLPDTLYDNKEYEMEEVIEKLISDAGSCSSDSDNPFLETIYRYCEWIGHEEDTAYVFLMRDAILPYVFFKSRNKDNLYPWLISRKFLEDITKEEGADDDVRIPLYEALENGYIRFDEYFTYCKGEILSSFDYYPELKELLLNLLGSIKQKRIVVVESGYMGTIPMMLKALDDRVDFRLFTTAPFLYETYKDKIFCQKYEEIRSFETLYSNDLFMQYSSYDNEKFYVKISNDEAVHDKAISEIKKMINLREDKEVEKLR
ncbi:hypothetical protein [Butyrivibrio proteoclasticus]|uniref:hypothetical protein n=1 Tax=Butyrivibrio proteoclasticus TaxID=43305 RepID=UPI0004798315|nr:hypothetical protein [Butyrivibrio proteoclasticus]